MLEDIFEYAFNFLLETFRAKRQSANTKNAQVIGIKNTGGKTPPVPCHEEDYRKGAISAERSWRSVGQADCAVKDFLIDSP
jgi:hypothetical protein